MPWVCLTITPSLSNTSCLTLQVSQPTLDPTVTSDGLMCGQWSAEMTLYRDEFSVVLVVEFNKRSV